MTKTTRSTRGGRSPKDAAPARGGGRRRLVVILAIGLAIVAAAGVTVYRPWLPLRYGRAEPPAPALDGLEPALATRIRGLTAQVRADPYGAEAWGQLGIVYEVHDLPDDALVCYRRARRLDPSDFRWTYFLGICMLPADHRGALEVLRQAETMKPDYAPLQIHLGRGFFDEGDLDRAQAHYERAVRLEPDLVRPYIGLAQVALARDDAAAAIGHLEDALAHDPKSPEVHLELSEAYRRLGDLEMAKKHLALSGGQRVFEEFPDAIRTQWQWEAGVTLFWRKARSDAYLRQGWLDRAAAEWTQMLRDDPNSARAWVELARIAKAARRPDDAITAYRNALRLDPEIHGARHDLGYLLLTRGKIEEGLAEMRRSCAGMPDNADAQGNLARALKQAGRPDEATDAMGRYGRLLAASGRYDEAAAPLREAAEARPEDGGVWIDLAEALVRAGRPREAADALEQALERAPGDEAVATALAWILATSPRDAVRDGPRALRLVAPIAAAHPTAHNLDVLAAAHAELGRFDEAVRVQTEAIRIATVLDARDDPEAQRERIRALESRRGGYRERKPYRDVP